MKYLTQHQTTTTFVLSNRAPASRSGTKSTSSCSLVGGDFRFEAMFICNTKKTEGMYQWA